MYLRLTYITPSALFPPLGQNVDKVKEDPKSVHLHRVPATPAPPSPNADIRYVSLLPPYLSAVFSQRTTTVTFPMTTY